MIITIPNGAKAIREGVEVKTKTAFIYKKKEAECYIKYLLGPKDNEDIIDPYVRTRHLKCNFSGMPLPVYGTDTFNKDLNETSKEFADLIGERQNYFSKLKPKRKHKKNEDPLFMEIIISLVDEEIQGLNEDNIVERLYQCGEHIVKGVTGQKEIINDIFMKPHLKYDPKRKGKLMPDMHILIGYYDYKGNPLNLGPDFGLSLLGNIHYEMENHKDFQFLLKTRTNAWEKEGMIKTVEEVKEVTDKIDEIIKANSNKPSIIHSEFVKAGIRLTPHRNTRRGIDYIEVKYQGETYRTTNKNFNKATTNSLRKYFDQKDFEDNYPKLQNAKYGTFFHLYSQMNEIFTEYKDKPLTELTDTLLSKGIISIPSFKKGEISGMKFILPRKDGNIKFAEIKAYTLDFDVSNYTYTEEEAKKILNKSKDFQHDKYIAIKNDEAIIDGEVYYYDEDHNLHHKQKTKLEKKADFIKWMEWIKNDGETLPEFQNRMIFSKNNRQTLLTSVYFKGEDCTVAYNKYNNRKAFEIINGNSFKVLQNNKSSVKAALQAYAAMNPLSDEEKIKGYKQVIRISNILPQNAEVNNKIWLEARLLGITVKGYEPPKEIIDEYEKQLKEKLDKHREQNARRLAKFAVLDEEVQGTHRLTLSYYKALENDVDRRSMAYACVDAFRLGVGIDYLMNPPKTHPNSRNRLLDRDLNTYRDLMIEEIRKVCPEREEEFIMYIDGNDYEGNEHKIKYKNKYK